MQRGTLTPNHVHFLCHFADHVCWHTVSHTVILQWPLHFHHDWGYNINIFARMHFIFVEAQTFLDK